MSPSSAHGTEQVFPPLQGHDIITPSTDLKQLRPNSPRLTLFNRVIIKAQKSQHVQEDGAEKANTEHTSGV